VYPSFQSPERTGEVGHTWIQNCDGEELDVAVGSVFAARSWQYRYSWEKQLENTYLPLQGLYGGTWSPGENIATCDINGACGSSPNSDCGCGFWAYWHHKLAASQGGHIEGVVEFYGHVLIGSKGCRAEKARIVALTVKTLPYSYSPGKVESEPIGEHQEVASEIQSHYDVPVFLNTDEMYKAFPINKEYYKGPEPAEYSPYTGLVFIHPTPAFTSVTSVTVTSSLPYVITCMWRPS
jgi:hypothetical protein